MASRDRVSSKLAGLRRELDELSQAGENVALWGSGSKAVSFLASLDAGDEIAWVVDINPHKHGMFLAGSGHEITGPERLKEDPPKRVIVMNAVYQAEVRATLAAIGLSARVSVL